MLTAGRRALGEGDLIRYLHGSPTSPLPAAERTAFEHHLPGTNPNLREFSEWYGLPFEATRGGAETLYPEYHKKLIKK